MAVGALFGAKWDMKIEADGFLHRPSGVFNGRHGRHGQQQMDDMDK